MRTSGGVAPGGNSASEPLAGAGFAPALSDEEAFTLELCGEMLRLHSDKAIYFHFKMHYQNWFPNLKDRPAFVKPHGLSL